ncbi:RNA-directed DNA polymerase, eukaryota, reverse transcriptase zinc-binding domain protein, partial [Tanacetum coccineum]
PSVEADYWKFTINNPHVFFVSVMRKHIDNEILDSSGTKVRWNKNIPIKINIFSWRLAINRLPTRYNLDIRGIDLDSTLCPVCNEAVETNQHLFLDCDIAQHLWKLIIKWWGLKDYPKDILGIVTWADSVSLPTKVKLIFDAVVLITNWSIWCYRNRRILDLNPLRKDTLEANIKTLSFSWFTYRNVKFNLDWNVWIYDPIFACNNIL